MPIVLITGCASDSAEEATTVSELIRNQGGDFRLILSGNVDQEEIAQIAEQNAWQEQVLLVCVGPAWSDTHEADEILKGIVFSLDRDVPVTILLCRGLDTLPQDLEDLRSRFAGIFKFEEFDARQFLPDAHAPSPSSTQSIPTQEVPAQQAPVPRSMQRAPGRIVGFPLWSVVIIALLLAAIIYAISN
jgi:hypothetical protein